MQTANNHYLITDYLGTSQLAINSQGQPTWRVLSDAFGDTVLDTNNQITINLRFPGQYYDQETGLNYNYFRNYNPKIGRYLQSDPIGIGSGFNLYGYAYANPLFYYDPYGLYSFDDFVNNMAGFGDGMSLGITAWLRDQFDIGSVDKCSKHYALGVFASSIYPTRGGPLPSIFAKAVKTTKKSSMELKEAKELMKQWEKQKSKGRNSETRANNMRYHYKMHGQGMSKEKYFRKASEAANNFKHGRDRSDGTTIYNKGNEFLIKRTSTGETVTYGFNKRGKL